MSSSEQIPQKSVWWELKTGTARIKAVLFALLFKELKVKMGKSRLGVLWVLLEPVVSMSMISLIWLIIGREKIDNIHVMLFIGSGYVVFLTVRRGIAPIPNAISFNRALLNYPQVKPLDTIFARYFLEMWLHSIASIWLFFALFWFIGIAPEFPDPLECIRAMGVAMLLSLGIAVPLAVYTEFYESLGRIVGILTQPLMILSAIIYSINDLPPAGRAALSWNPIVHIVSSFRHGAFGIPLFEGHNLAYPAFVGLGLLGFGMIAYYANRYRLIQK